MSSGRAAEKPFPVEAVRRLIHAVRGQNVMLDSDLAELYDVETGALIRAMKRNSERFPDDFVFQLTLEEWEGLRCQTGISNDGRGGRRYAPTRSPSRASPCCPASCEAGEPLRSTSP